jgi:hypothetical protein
MVEAAIDEIESRMGTAIMTSPTTGRNRERNAALAPAEIASRTAT